MGLTSRTRFSREALCEEEIQAAAQGNSASAAAACSLALKPESLLQVGTDQTFDTSAAVSRPPPPRKKHTHTHTSYPPHLPQFQQRCLSHAAGPSAGRRYCSSSRSRPASLVLLDPVGAASSPRPLLYGLMEWNILISAHAAI